MVPSLDTVNLAIGRALRMKKDYAGAAGAYGEMLKQDARNQKRSSGSAARSTSRAIAPQPSPPWSRLIAIDGATNEAAEARSLLEQVRK